LTAARAASLCAAVKDLQHEVESLVSVAASAALNLPSGDPLLRAAKDAQHGDYQSNLAMALGKELKRPPREIATAIADNLRQRPESAGAFAKIEVAGPGFINLTLTDSFVSERLSALHHDARLGVPLTAVPDVVVVDYSGPNLAKEMHVGHLRSTIIGDAICRLLAFNGDRVIRQNHLGDWGTQFGMLLEHLLDSRWGEQESSIRDLNDLYQLAKTRFDVDPAFAERSRLRVVQLQAGEERSRAVWQRLIAESVRHLNAVYQRLGVLLSDADIRPESSYNPVLPEIVTELRAAGVLVEDQGAQVVFPDGMQNKEGERMPLFVQKTDGGYGYATTDLAAARYRARDLGATRLVYVVDARQADHFKALFWTLRAAGWVKAEVRLEHVPFGTILGADRKPFKTRTGGTVKLVELLEEAVTRAQQAIAEKNPDLSETERTTIATAVGIGAVKYADLSSERIKDYAFDYDRMLAFEGNTAPYLQYAYVRIQSIFRKGGVQEEELKAQPIVVEHAAERALALHLLRLPRVIEAMVRSLEPHRLCGYLYELASLFHAFHHSCRVLNAESEASQRSRLGLCLLTRRGLKLGLDLLGIEAVDAM
jgi:arginyl-tRNA synthetase